MKTKKPPVKTTSRPRVSVKTRQLMLAFEHAAQAKAWRGYHDPASRTEVDQEYRRARSAFVRHLVRLENPPRG